MDALGVTGEDEESDDAPLNPIPSLRKENPREPSIDPRVCQQ